MKNIAEEIIAMCDYAQKTENLAAVILTSRLIAEIAKENGLEFNLRGKRIHGLRWFPVIKNIMVVTCDGMIITPMVVKQIVNMAEDLTPRLRLN
jgi:hypothetical protein